MRVERQLQPADVTPVAGARPRVVLVVGMLDRQLTRRAAPSHLGSPKPYHESKARVATVGQRVTNRVPIYACRYPGARLNRPPGEPQPPRRGQFLSGYVGLGQLLQTRASVYILRTRFRGPVCLRAPPSGLSSSTVSTAVRCTAVLRSRHLVVHWFSSPDAAQPQLADIGPDVIVTDFVFHRGDTDGPSFIRSVRTMNGFAEVPIVVVSGYVRAVDRMVAREAGATMFCTSRAYRIS